MIVAREEYELTEDIVTIVSAVKNGRFICERYYQADEENKMTLDKVSELFRGACESLIDITVLAEEPHGGRVLRYDKNKDIWECIGILKGYS